MNSKAKEFLSRIVGFVIGEEVFPQELYDAIRMYNPDGRVYNGYGPTETTLCVVVNELRERNDITIGPLLPILKSTSWPATSVPLPLVFPAKSILPERVWGRVT